MPTCPKCQHTWVTHRTKKIANARRSYSPLREDTECVGGGKKPVAPCIRCGSPSNLAARPRYMVCGKCLWEQQTKGTGNRASYIMGVEEAVSVLKAACQKTHTTMEEKST